MSSDTAPMFFEELLKKTAKEQKVSVEKMREVYKHFINWAKEEINTTDTVAIQMPFFGTIHAKKAHIDNILREQKHILEDDPNNEDAKKLAEAYQGKVNAMDEHCEKYGKTMTKTLHGRTDRRFYKKNLRDGTMDEAQIIQNEQFRKYKNEE